jgi:RNA polymerase sigma factor (sigma-70 family)
MTDGQLLECFVTRRDEVAFAALVRRHGPMVWSVCGRVLRDLHDAEDAFQATFLVLVRRAGSVVPREKVANWLYGVAYQTARKARAAAARKLAREKRVADVPEPSLPDSETCADLWLVLDRELSHLPDKYRSAILYCDLEGKTRKEAAGQFGVPEGTLSGWLSRGRTLLAKRLARRGLLLSSGVLAAGLTRTASAAGVSAVVPRAVIEAATGAVARQETAGSVSSAVESLTKRVMRTMFLHKLKRIALAAAVLGAIGLGGGFLSRDLATAQQEKPSERHAAGTPAGREPAKADRYLEAVKKDLAALQGEWELVSFVGYGTNLDLPADRAKRTLVIAGNEATLFVGPQEIRMTWLIDPTRQIKALDICYEKSKAGDSPFEGKVAAAVYEIDGDTLTECSEDPGNQRPEGFHSPRGTHRSLMVYKRIRR